jgi:CII-binding regulator of phage lambda lysogenization HflD
LQGTTGTKEALDKIKRFGPQELANTIWALAKLGQYCGVELLDAFALHFTDVITNLCPQVRLITSTSSCTSSSSQAKIRHLLIEMAKKLAGWKYV